MMSTGAAESSSRMPSLDGLRGVAIGLVLLHNLNIFGSLQAGPGHVLDRIFDIGWIGVQLFFVLSGFLITGILLDTRRSPNYYLSFFGRRVLRIFPLYYGSLLFVFVVLPAFGRLPTLFENDVQGQAWFWLYLSNWTADEWQAFPHYWSLAVEEQFYLLWPLVVHRCSPRRLLKLCFGIAVVAGLVRLGMRGMDVSPSLVYTSSLGRMDALALGAAGAVLIRDPVWVARWHERTFTFIGVACLLLLATAVVSGGFQRTSLLGQTLGYSGLSFTFSLIVLIVALADGQWTRTHWPNVFAWAPLRSLGKYSYAMYIFHRPMHKLVGEPLLAMLSRPVRESITVGVFYVATMGLMAFVAAKISYRAIELPFLRLKHRLVAQPGPP